MIKKRVFFSTNYTFNESDGKYYADTNVNLGLRQALRGAVVVTSGYPDREGDGKKNCELQGEIMLLSGNIFVDAVRLYKQVKSSDYVVFKMFQLVNVFVFFLCVILGRRFTTILVGDAAKSFSVREDIIKSSVIRYFFSRLIRFFVTLVVKKSEYTIFVSKSLKEIYGGRQLDVVASESWLDERWFLENKTQRDIDVLYVGRLVREKGLFELISALAAIKTNKALRVVFVGDGKDRKDLELFADMNEISIEFVGKIPHNSDELISFYRRSHYFILPSYSEGMPLCILEAAANRCIPIVTDVGGVKELLGDFYPFLIKPGSIEDLKIVFKQATQLSDDNRKRIIDENFLRAKQRSFSREQGKMWETLRGYLNEN